MIWALVALVVGLFVGYWYGKRSVAEQPVAVTPEQPQVPVTQPTAPAKYRYDPDSHKLIRRCVIIAMLFATTPADAGNISVMDPFTKGPKNLVPGNGIAFTGNVISATGVSGLGSAAYANITSLATKAQLDGKVAKTTLLPNPVDYGAVANNPAIDSYAAFVAAMTASGNGSFRLPVGTYYIGTALQLQDGATWIGVPNHTIIKQLNGTTQNVFLKNNAGSGFTSEVYIQGIIFDGDASGTNSAVSVATITGVKKFTGKDLTFRNGSGYGLGFQSRLGHETFYGPQEDIFLENVRFENNGHNLTADKHDGLDVKDCKRFVGIGLTAFGNADKGIDVRGEAVTITAPIAYDNGNSGMEATGNSSSSGVESSVTILGGSLYDNATNGLRIDDGSPTPDSPVRVIVTGTQIHGNGEKGLFADSHGSQARLTVNGVQSWSNGTAPSNAQANVYIKNVGYAELNNVLAENGLSDGLILDGAASAKINGGSYRNNARQGVWEANGATGNVFTGTTATGNVTNWNLSVGSTRHDAVTAGSGIAVTGQQVSVGISGLTADATPDLAADYVMTLDATDASLKKVLLNTIVAGAGSEYGDVYGGITAGGNITIGSTTHPTTKGKILVGTSGYDEANNRLGIRTSVPDTTVHVRGTSPTLRMQADSSSDYFDVSDTGASGKFDKYRASGSVIMDFDPRPGDAGSASTVRLFRTTNTTGRASLQILLGTNSSTSNHELAGTGNSYLAANNGLVGVGVASPLAKLHVAESNAASATTIIIENTSTASATTKVSGIDLYGRDTISSNKSTVRLLEKLGDANRVNVGLSIHTRLADSVAERAWFAADGGITSLGTITAKQFTETAYAPAGTAITISLANGTIQRVTTTAATTLNLPTLTAGQSLTLNVCQGATPYAVTFGGTAPTWRNGTAYVVAQVANGCSKIVLDNDGVETMAAGDGPF